MKKSGNRNGRGNYTGQRTYWTGSEKWNRQAGNDDEKADEQSDWLSARGHGWKCVGTAGEFHIQSQTQKRKSNSKL